MDFSSMSDGELRRAHAMFLADPQSFANNPSYMHAIVQEHARRFSPGNVEADLDAASTPIEPDPMAGQDLAMPYPPFNYGQYRTVRQRSRRGLGPEPMDAMETDGDVRARYDAKYGEGAYDADTPGREYRQGPNAPAWARPSGFPVQSQVPPGDGPDADPRTTRAQRLAQHAEWSAGVDRRAAEYNRDTGLTPPDTSVADQRGPYPGAGRPGYDRTFTPREVLAQRADMESGASGGTPLAFTVPSPRMPYGRDVRPGAPIYDEEQAAAYTQRPVDPRTMQASPSQRDNAMRARGMVPVYNPDGSIGYSVESYPEDDPSTPQNEGLPFPGGVGRLGRREDLLDAGWEARPVDGPTGKQTVYRPGATAQARYDAQADARTVSRLKRSAGISSEEVAAMPLAEGESVPLAALRKRSRDAKDDDYNARNARWQAQAMLAGGQPTGGQRGSKATLAAWDALGQEGLNDWQRLTMAKALRPDIDGTSPLTVEANSAKNAMRLINADMVGQGGLGDTRAQMMAQKQRADAAAYADSQWAQKPSRARTTAARERLMRDIENRFGPGTGIVAAELEVNDTPAQQATGAQSTNPTQVGPPPNPMNPSFPLAVPSRPPGV